MTVATNKPPTWYLNKWCLKLQINTRGGFKYNIQRLINRSLILHITALIALPMEYRVYWNQLTFTFHILPATPNIKMQRTQMNNLGLGWYTATFHWKLLVGFTLLLDINNYIWVNWYIIKSDQLKWTRTVIFCWHNNAEIVWFRWMSQLDIIE